MKSIFDSNHPTLSFRYIEQTHLYIAYYNQNNYNAITILHFSLRDDEIIENCKVYQFIDMNNLLILQQYQSDLVIFAIL